ncbi:MAG: hypothetical protein V4772_25780 [Pseudomonadota bacterium]
MDNIIVYVDDAAYALGMLQVLQAPRTSDGLRKPVRWIVVGCAPRVTHRVSKWVTHSARENWRGKWADKVFAHLLPLLQQEGDTVVTQLAEGGLPGQTEILTREYGNAQVLDARKPRNESGMQTAASRAGSCLMACMATLSGTAFMLAAD